MIAPVVAGFGFPGTKFAASCGGVVVKRATKPPLRGVLATSPTFANSLPSAALARDATEPLPAGTKEYGRYPSSASICCTRSIGPAATTIRIEKGFRSVLQFVATGPFLPADIVIVIVMLGISCALGVKSSVFGLGRVQRPASTGVSFGSAEWGRRFVEKRSLKVPLKSSTVPFVGVTATMCRPDLALGPVASACGWGAVTPRCANDPAAVFRATGRTDLVAEYANAATGTLDDSTTTRAPSSSSRRRPGCSADSVATADCML